MKMPLEYSTKEGRMKIFGFWIFLGAEVVLFATLFAAYLVYHHQTAGGPSSRELFEVKEFMMETLLLLTSSFTCGLAMLEMRKDRQKGFMAWMGVTLLLGLGFLYMEIHEFIAYVNEGATIGTSAFLSAFFTLLGTHGLHVSLGIVWVLAVMLQISRRGFTPMTARKAFITGLYWHFLDVVWIFIFTAVYLMGVM
ncbi:MULTISPECIES: cytochrome aa3 quinol oxidase subunit III [Thermoactinomyces]|jgi:cytochrome aa3-600 menaquinol oxidase subunit III|uniref:Quinol oxidase subunit 3 n=1 Tax=Thermoactinomyces vulgaris TaxID=2026 RepID=A0ABS0QGQ3_THEVU|nr:MULTISPECIES: cytochrome aa3 quinol oxidase subunit III [Thermoactinomyces]KFZ40835.1 cytochrome o ubiquinol oxidase subunit III [Thermoactinomyces sp. Gus2-1]KYQ86788.1 cytochrome o ubiquinol oxidase subunit III [Thermoactinomyces sp. AS95]MBA4550678.1 cytochrome aa3 quinol oxidase subunit III [Thermoactinomyces vulgaris]MBA4596263.1 cytochrome aa3 quinol oxidase subunit III [Thermoactinomyces vulgaris]MBH8583006.1 cytochrome aa3 quinol oxidase subunit III [Thermoactinomyces sp. CICC 10735